MMRKVACDLPRCEQGNSRLIREIFVGIEVCEYDKLKVGGINERIVCLKQKSAHHPPCRNRKIRVCSVNLLREDYLPQRRLLRLKNLAAYTSQ